MRTPSIEPIQESRLLPRISFRMMFLLTAVAAAIIAVTRRSGDGGALAVSAVIAMGFIAICLGIFVLLFLFAWGVSLISPGDPEELVEGSPFAEDQLPPQILPPRDPQL